MNFCVCFVFVRETIFEAQWPIFWRCPSLKFVLVLSLGDGKKIKSGQFVLSHKCTEHRQTTAFLFTGLSVLPRLLRIPFCQTCQNSSKAIPMFCLDRIVGLRWIVSFLVSCLCLSRYSQNAPKWISRHVCWKSSFRKQRAVWTMCLRVSLHCGKCLFEDCRFCCKFRCLSSVPWEDSPAVVVTLLLGQYWTPEFVCTWTFFLSHVYVQCKNDVSASYSLFCWQHVHKSKSLCKKGRVHFCFKSHKIMISATRFVITAISSTMSPHELRTFCNPLTPSHFQNNFRLHWKRTITTSSCQRSHVVCRNMTPARGTPLRQMGGGPTPALHPGQMIMHPAYHVMSPAQQLMQLQQQQYPTPRSRHKVHVKVRRGHVLRCSCRVCAPSDLKHPMSPLFVRRAVWATSRWRRWRWKTCAACWLASRGSTRLRSRSTRSDSIVTTSMGWWVTITSLRALDRGWSGLGCKAAKIKILQDEPTLLRNVSWLAPERNEWRGQLEAQRPGFLVAPRWHVCRCCTTAKWVSWRVWWAWRSATGSCSGRWWRRFGRSPPREAPTCRRPTRSQSTRRPHWCVTHTHARTHTHIHTHTHTHTRTHTHMRARVRPLSN